MGPMVCWLTRNSWLVGTHGLLTDKKWLDGWGGHGLLADKKWLAGWRAWFVG